MLSSMVLNGVGPTREMSLVFADRLNILTGDNGLGKSFVLDMAWWLLTASWSGEPAVPSAASPASRALRDAAPTIAGYLRMPGASADNVDVTLGGWFHRESFRWRRCESGIGVDGVRRIRRDFEMVAPPPRDVVPGLVIYARVDGTVAVQDAMMMRDGSPESEGVILFSGAEIWDGKRGQDPYGREKMLCRGLIEDWVTWQGTNAPEFESLCEVLTALSEPDEPLVPGKPARVRLDDRRDVPTLALVYGEVPVTIASAGMRRVLSLAYLLVWAWAEHIKAAELTGRPPATEITLLIDEPEAHLHPAWQRVFLPSVLRAVRSLAQGTSAQIFAATHSPLVLASLETLFDARIDDLFHFQRDGKVVRVEELPYARQGDASNWLVSEAFGLTDARSREAELAIEAAMAVMREDTRTAEESLRALQLLMPDLQGADTLVAWAHRALLRTLPDHDSFWARWIVSNVRHLDQEPPQT